MANLDLTREAIHVLKQNIDDCMARDAIEEAVKAIDQIQERIAALNQSDQKHAFEAALLLERAKLNFTKAQRSALPMDSVSECLALCKQILDNFKL